jgi:hypothetical protein
MESCDSKPQANIKVGDVATVVKNDKGLVILDRTGTQLVQVGGPGGSRPMRLQF